MSENTPQNAPLYLHGHGVVPGVKLGRAFVIKHDKFHLPQFHIDKTEIEREIKRFRDSIQLSYLQLSEIKEDLSAESENAAPGEILSAHIGMTKDTSVQGMVEQTIENELINAEWALQKTLEYWIKILNNSDNDYFKERVSDLKFVISRIQRNLAGHKEYIKIPPPDAVVVANELSPAETVMLGRNAITAIVTRHGGKTSHTVIIAKAFEIPTVIGVDEVTSVVGDGDLLLVDGLSGTVIVNPTPEQVVKYRNKMAAVAAFEHDLIKSCIAPSITPDNKHIKIYANIDFVEESDNAKKHGAEGIGLYRTEFIFITRKTTTINEEIHFKDTFELMKNWPDSVVTIRTFDLGGDKNPIFKDENREANPALGLRSIRFALRTPDIFKSQVRGIFRAWSFFPEVKLNIMFPLISCIDEFYAAKELTLESHEELLSEGYDLKDNFKIGSMMELPGALLISDVLATEADFFSIGTNDLIQYTLGVDRGNEKVSELYDPLHPGVLKLIQSCITAGKNANIPVSICGDMSTDLMSVILLIGMGAEILSMPALSMPNIKRFIKRLPYSKAAELTKQALKLPNSQEIKNFLGTEAEDILEQESWPTLDSEDEFI